jgi:hypothetical protein
MTQKDFIRNELAALNQIAEDYGTKIHTFVMARNIVLKLIRDKQKELKRFEKWDKKQRRKGREITKTIAKGIQAA